MLTDMRNECHLLTFGCIQPMSLTRLNFENHQVQFCRSNRGMFAQSNHIDVYQQLLYHIYEGCVLSGRCHDTHSIVRLQLSGVKGKFFESTAKFTCWVPEKSQVAQSIVSGSSWALLHLWRSPFTKCACAHGKFSLCACAICKRRIKTLRSMLYKPKESAE